MACYDHADVCMTVTIVTVMMIRVSKCILNFDVQLICVDCEMKQTYVLVLFIPFTNCYVQFVLEWHHWHVALLASRI